jgi:hypothetical protein
VQWLRKKGLAGADKKAGRLAAEGVVATYIHPGSRLGVMVEINCETDFVAASDKFLDLVNEVAMIIAASPEVSSSAAAWLPSSCRATSNSSSHSRTHSADDVRTALIALPLAAVPGPLQDSTGASCIVLPRGARSTGSRC